MRLWVAAAVLALAHAGPIVFTIDNVTPWRYWDVATAVPTGWNTVDFNDSAWREGSQPLGYGKLNQTTTTGFCNRVTCYFRTELYIPFADAFIWDMTGYFDDGAVVYVNGVEAWRWNMPTGPVTRSTLALTSVQGAGETTLRGPQAMPANLITTGVNVIAVEVHQFLSTSSDLLLDLYLRGTETVNDVWPSALVSTPLVPSGSVWKYLDTGAYDVVYRSPGYSDVQWRSGKAPLGYGSGGAFATAIARSGMVAFFRKSVTVSADVTDGGGTFLLQGTVSAQDGAVVYVNGVEGSRRENMDEASPTITSTTPALTVREALNTSSSPVYWSANVLHSGVNVIVAEVHQASTASPNLGFDFSLSLLALPSTTPTPTPSATPSPSVVSPSATTTPSAPVVPTPSPTPTATASESPSSSESPAPTSSPVAAAVVGGSTADADPSHTIGFQVGIAVGVVVVACVVGAVMMVVTRRRQSRGGAAAKWASLNGVDDAGGPKRAAAAMDVVMDVHSVSIGSGSAVTSAEAMGARVDHGAPVHAVAPPPPPKRGPVEEPLPLQSGAGSVSSPVASTGSGNNTWRPNAWQELLASSGLAASPHKVTRADRRREESGAYLCVCV